MLRAHSDHYSSAQLVSADMVQRHVDPLRGIDYIVFLTVQLDAVILHVQDLDFHPFTQHSYLPTIYLHRPPLNNRQQKAFVCICFVLLAM